MAFLMRIMAGPGRGKRTLLCWALFCLLVGGGGLARAAGTWAALVNPAPGNPQDLCLLTDGTVLAQNGGSTTWYRLTPDTHGSYVNGTWTTIAPMHDTRRFMATQVLRDGRVFVAGGEYGTGATTAEVYDPLANTWTYAPNSGANFIDAISELLPDGNVLVCPVYSGAQTLVYNVANNTWSNGPVCLGGQDEASWVKLGDGSILTVDPFGINSERYLPSLNQWVADASLPTTVYGYGGELGAAFLLPNGNAIFFGATNHTAIYTPSGNNGPGTWRAGANIPNNLGAVDAPAAMMVNGLVLAAFNTDTGYSGPSYFYEYDYAADAFTLVGSPTGGTAYSPATDGLTMLALPDGTVLLSNGSSQLYAYRPGGAPLASGRPVISSVATNADGSLHLTGLLFNGISEGAAYGDDAQMATDYPIAWITNSAGQTRFCRTFNWSGTAPMTGTNVVTTELTLPPGLLAGTYPLVVAANGNPSAPVWITTAGAPLALVAGLGFTLIRSNQMALQWSALGETETGYVVQRSLDGTNFTNLGATGVATLAYQDNSVTPLKPYYYRVVGSNAFGLGLACPAILAASPGAVAASAPWQDGDLGTVPGAGAAGVSGGGYGLIGGGAGVGGANDTLHELVASLAGDFVLTARLTYSTGGAADAPAGLLLRSAAAPGARMLALTYNSARPSVVFSARTTGNTVPTVLGTLGSVGLPGWLRLSRSGNRFTGAASPDGVNWSPLGTIALPLEAVVSAGMMVGGGTANLLNTAGFDQVTVTGTPAVLPPAFAHWKLDEATGSVAADSTGGFDGAYTNAVLGQAGATTQSGTSIFLNGTNANVVVPALNLNTNTLTLTAWVRRSGNQNQWAGIFFNRANNTVAGLHFGTANELRYTWNNAAGSYNFNSSLVPPNNQWVFVALVVEPARARLYQYANGLLAGATNNLAHPVQAFDGSGYLGEDPTSSTRSMTGWLDDVALYPGLALTPAQLTQLANPPLLTLTSPANNSGTPAPGSVTLAATVTGATSHTVQAVQFFQQGVLVGTTAASPPYSLPLTNLAAGNYTFGARLFYDSGWTVESDAVSFAVLNPPAVPSNVTATALAGNVVNVTWSPANSASGYFVYRDGALLTAVAATGWTDTTVTPGANHCYTVVATNLVAVSGAGAAACATTPGAGTALVWDAGASGAGPQDGSGNWDGTTADWWNGASAGAWSDGSLAVIGVNSPTNCAVNLTATVAPSGLVVNAPGAGGYTLGGSGALNLAGTPVITVNGSAVITTPLTATALTKSGGGALVLGNANPGLNATVLVNAGSLEMQAGPAATQIGYVVGPNGLLRHGYNTSPNYTKGIVVYGDAVNSGHGLAVAAGTTLSEQNITLSNAPTTISGYGAGANGQLQGFDINGDNLLVRAAASGSVVATNVSLNLAGGYGLRINVESGANTGAGDLTVAGPVTGGNNSLYKYGAGSLRLAGVNTYSVPTLLNGGTLQLASAATPLGSGLLNFVVSATLQSVVGVAVGNAITIGSGQTATFDTLTNTLSLAGVLTNAGALSKISAGKLILGGAGAGTGTLTVRAGTLQVDGSTGTGAVSVRSGAQLSGVGVVRGATTILSGGLLAPGDGGFGVLTVSNALTLAGQTLLKIGRFDTGLTNDYLAVTGPLQYGGTLVVSNAGSRALAGGDACKLFSLPAAGTYFSSITLPPLPAGLAWNTNALRSGGTISVVNTTTPAFATAGIVGGQLVLQGAGGVGGAGYAVLGTTNLALPLAQWSRVATNTFQTDGSFSVTNAMVNTAGPVFYSVQLLPP